MSNLYLTREAAEALLGRRPDDVDVENVILSEMEAGREGIRTALREFQRRALDSLPIVDAGEGEAEAALGDLHGFALDGAVACFGGAAEVDARMAKVNLLVSTIRHALRAAQAQADAPPPLDVIRRGHSGIGRLSDAARTGTYSDAEIEAACADARAAMHPLPKEE